MAEWLMRGTVNTFFRGSIPLEAFKYKILILYLYKILIKEINNYISEHVEIGKQSPLKQEWK
jgi:hypothetical protein